MRSFFHYCFNAVCVGLCCFTVFLSCSPAKRGLFAKKTAHEKYGERLESAGLNTTVMGKLWFTAADKSLSSPLRINLPYQETGYFAADKPRAAGYRFTARRGEKLSVKITTIPGDGVLLFTELWQAGNATDKPELLEALDTLTQQLEYEVGKETDFIIRLQPELLKGVEYTLSINTQASLAFPVQSSGKPRVISLWGSARDGGSRNHEGVDIAATFRTPVLAGADGRVAQVTENNLGGKVIFMSPEGKNYSLYYAHLDSQIATPGLRVKQGDILGLLGNTGNARTTSPHLHFGIYTTEGAIDPLPFINQEKITISAITASLKELNQFVRNRSATSVYTEPSPKGQVLASVQPDHALHVLSATGNWYKVLLPNEQEGFVNSNTVTNAAIRQLTIKKETRLLDTPVASAAAMTILKPGDNVSVLGKYGDYYLVRQNERNGWIMQE